MPPQLATKGGEYQSDGAVWSAHKSAGSAYCPEVLPIQIWWWPSL